MDALLRHCRGWLSFFRGIDSDFNDSKDEDASAWRGFLRWVKGGLYRGYAIDDDGTPYEEDYYLCPWAYNPRTIGFKLGRLLGADEIELEAHEAGHLRKFAAVFPEHVGTQPDGSPWPLAANGLGHEPPGTHDIMVDGRHFWMRTKDERRIQATFQEWKAAGRVKTVHD